MLCESWPRVGWMCATIATIACGCDGDGLRGGVCDAGKSVVWRVRGCLTCLGLRGSDDEGPGVAHLHYIQ
jgi:hypothetical protein